MVKLLSAGNKFVSRYHFCYGTMINDIVPVSQVGGKMEILLY